MRRTLTAATAGGLTLAGALLGIVGPYVVLFGAFIDHPSELERVPS